MYYMLNTINDMTKIIIIRYWEYFSQIIIIIGNRVLLHNL